MSADRDLFLHEFIDINGMHQWDYMEHTRQQSGDEKVEFELLGTWYTMGITARWPQVVTCGRSRAAGTAGSARSTASAEAVEQRDAQRVVEAGVRVPLRRVRPALGAARGCPTMATLAADDVRGSLFVHELTEVRPGPRRLPRRGPRGARAAARRVRPPVRGAVRGADERLRGVHGLGDEGDDHVRVAHARDVARGLVGRRATSPPIPASRPGTTAPGRGAAHWPRSS